MSPTDLARNLRAKSGIAQTLHQLGTLAQAQGNYAEAVRLYQESLQLKEELGDKSGIASTLGQLGRLAKVQGRLKEALGYLLPALAIFEELHAPYREPVRKWIAEIRQQAGEAQFAAWAADCGFRLADLGL